MELSRGIICVGSLLQYSVIIITVSSMELNDRHNRRQRIVRWTDKFGRDRTSMADPKAQANKEDASTTNPYNNSDKFKPVVPLDKNKDKNEINIEGNDTVASLLAHPPISPERSTILYDTIPGQEFCDGQLPDTRICDPEDVISIKEEKQMQNALSEICNGTGCPCGNCSLTKSQCPGYRVSVLVFSSDPYGGEKYTYQAYVQLAKTLRTELWDYGWCDEDVVVVMDTGTDQIFTSIGSKAAVELNPQCAGEVLFDAQNLLNHKNYGQVLIQILRDYKKVFLSEFKCVIQRDYVMPTGHIIAIIFGSVCLPIMVCVISVFLGPCFRGSGFGGKRHKTTFSKYRYQAQNSDGTWASASPQIADDNASLAESGRMMESGLAERRGAAVML